MIEYVTKDAIIDIVYFGMDRVLLYESVVQYNNMQEKDRIAQKGAMLPDGYSTSISFDWEQVTPKMQLKLL